MPIGTDSQMKVIAAILLKSSGLSLSMLPVKVEEGPVITNFYFRPANSIPLAKIMNRANDFAQACGVDSILITRDKDLICMSVPNTERKLIQFDKKLYETAQFVREQNIKIPIILGEDTRGNTITLALEKQPHILIAGSTGSGKSVLLSSILCGIACLRSKEEVKTILCDTKKLDLPLFSDLPHQVDTIKDIEEFHKVFDRVFHIVRGRTKKLEGNSRNIDEYNKLAREMGEKELCRYVIVIDELADLVDSDYALRKMKEEWIMELPTVNRRIKQLIQICRAVGVHLICATQRSSIKVIDGDIKTNFPTRIALKVPSMQDSRVILDSNGAEYLLGNGDMLVKTMDTDVLKRYHGAYVSIEDIYRTVQQCNEIRKSLNVSQTVVEGEYV